MTTRLNLLQTLRQSLPFLARDNGGLPRGEMLALRPVRSREIAWELKAADADSPGATLTVPRRDDRMGQILSRLLQIPPSKTIELDEFGAAVWERCDGRHSVEQLIAFTCSAYKLNRRQAEVSVVTFMRMLAQRRLIGLQKKTAPNVTAKVTEQTAGKGTAHVHRSDRPRAQSKGRKRRY